MSIQTPNLNTVQSMNSIQIAELSKQRHDNVKRTIERLVDQGVIASPQIEGVQETKGNSRTYTTETYIFKGEQGKLDSITVVAQLCPHFTASIVKRWQELESQTSNINPQALIAQNQALQSELLKARPQWQSIIDYKDIGLDTHEIAKLIERSKATVCRYVNTMQTLGYEVSNEPQPAQLSLALKEV